MTKKNKFPGTRPANECCDRFLIDVAPTLYSSGDCQISGVSISALPDNLVPFVPCTVGILWQKGVLYFGRRMEDFLIL